MVLKHTRSLRHVDALQDLADLLHTQDDRQRLGPSWAHTREDRPRAVERVLKEKREGAQSHSAGSPRNAFLVAQVQEILAQFFFTDLIGWLPIMGS